MYLLPLVISFHFCGTGFYIHKKGTASQNHVPPLLPLPIKSQTLHNTVTHHMGTQYTYTQYTSPVPCSIAHSPSSPQTIPVPENLRVGDLLLGTQRSHAVLSQNRIRIQGKALDQVFCSTCVL